MSASSPLRGAVNARTGGGRRRRDGLRPLLSALLPALSCTLTPTAAGAQGADRSAVLWYERPAREWIEALPVGNGRLGAMVFGGTGRERIQFNESTLWSGGPRDYSHPGASAALPRIRSLLFDGDQATADSVAAAAFMSVPLTQESYQAFGDLHVELRGAEAPATAYRRELDLDRGIATTRFRSGGTTYTREVFASHPAGALVVHITADRPGQVSVAASLTSAHAGAERRAAAGDQLVMAGRVEGGSIRYEARLVVRAAGGRVSLADTLATVVDADFVTLILAGATNFVRYDDVSADPGARNDRTLAALHGVAFQRLRADHLRDHRELFRRVSIDLGTSPPEVAAAPTDRRLAGFSSRPDPGLVALLFQYGRYLLIASSRPGGQPANLQGLWNDNNRPPWGSKWTVNVNTEMNYWLAEPTGLGELTEPLFAMIRDVAETGARTARVHYDQPGWVLHHNTDLWRGSAPIDGPQWGLWPMGGAWLTQHLWWRWEYGGDVAFLRKAYPLMRGASRFFVDYLVTDPRTGWLITGPSVSPENKGIVMGPTMDHQLLRDLFARTIEASEILGVDGGFADTLRDLRSRLAPNQIGRLGQLQEWLEDRDDPDDRHRHVSHLWGLHPGSEITHDGTPDLFAAARRSLELRGDGGTGWSKAWKVNFWARLRDGDRAYRLLTSMITPTRERSVGEGGGLYPNLFDAHPPFQIDGNFGLTSGIVEMLVQDHEGEIHLLPALPAAWPRGRVRGLRTRGGFVVDLVWDNGSLEEGVLQATRSGTARVRYGGTVTEYRMQAGDRVSLPVR
jgi:alpha-L-fucosidase 2